jgi:hypothetical protein
MKKEQIVEALESQPLWLNLLKKDCEEGTVFIAIRGSKIDFYHKGGRLFSFDGTNFKTHIKYASVIDKDEEKESDYLTEEQLSKRKLISKFESQYARIKENCERYSGAEAKGVSNVYRKHSYLSEADRFVVLDIEGSFKSEDEGRTQDRIDILLFDKKSRTLQFVEAKHFSNKEIWSTKTPRVIGQIKKYEKQIAMRRDKMIERWTENVKYLNKLFGIRLPSPKSIDEKVTLLIFGYDRDQENGRLKKWIVGNKEFSGIKCYCRGSTKEITPELLWSAPVLQFEV